MTTPLRSLLAPLLLALCCAQTLVACGGGVDDTTSTDDLTGASKHKCKSDANCTNGYVCVSGHCQKGGPPPPPPPPPPPSGCHTMHDCAGGGLCESGQCVASACAHRASNKTGIRATVVITRYQGLISGRNGSHEIAFGTLGQVEWIHDPALEDSQHVQLALNVSSSTDPSGLPHEIPLSVGQTIEVEGEYITAASAGTSGDAVIHFTHSTCGYVAIAGITYQ